MEHEGCRVLVVDDEDLVISVIREVLQLRDLEISEASDGESAVERLGQERFDLVIAGKKLEVSRLKGDLILWNCFR